MESSAACWARYGEVLAREYSDPRYRRANRLTVDAFAVQHPGRPGPQSTQSVGVHLLSLFAVLERQMSCAAATSLIGRAVGQLHFVWLEPPDERGAVNVESVLATTNPAEHREAVHRWASSAWNAWAAYHRTIAAWARQVGFD